MTERRLLLVHAHPDDESSQTAATMARYVAEGAAVTLVTCTLGEHGEILAADLGHLTPETLGAHRLGELTQAMDVLGVSDFVRLGGDGRWSDSGMEHAETGMAQPRADVPEASFWRADLLEAADELVAIIRDRRPQVVVTYNPVGGYGHPDHIQAHRVTMYAVALAGLPTHRLDLGEPWTVQRTLWMTWRSESFRAALRQAREAGMTDIFPDLDPELDGSPFGSEDAEIGAIVEARPWIGRMGAALAAHRSQVDMADPFWSFFATMLDQPGAGEAYLFAGGVPFPPSERPHDDIFAGLNG